MYFEDESYQKYAKIRKRVSPCRKGSTKVQTISVKNILEDSCRICIEGKYISPLHVFRLHQEALELHGAMMVDFKKKRKDLSKMHMKGKQVSKPALYNDVSLSHNNSSTSR